METINLRSPSYAYNHGGYYAPADPRMCNTPGGPCGACQDRIDKEDAALALIALKEPCCETRPPFMEPCPSCGNKSSYVTHASKGMRTCNGCEDNFCVKCYYGSRYCCAYVYGRLDVPEAAERQLTLGVQSPKAEEK